MNTSTMHINQKIRDRYFLPLLLLILTDFAVFSVTFLFAYFVRYYTTVSSLVPVAEIPDSLPYFKLSAVIALMGMLIYERFGFYQHRIGLDRRVRSSSMIIATVVVYVFLMAFLFIYNGGYSRLTVALAVPFSCFAVVFMQHFLRKVQFLLVKRGIVFLKTAIIGPHIRCMEVTQKIQEYHGSEYQILGFIDTNGKTGRDEIGIPYLGSIEQLDALLKKGQIDNLIVALSPRDNHLVSTVIKTCKENKTAFQIVPDIYDDVIRNVGFLDVDDLPFLPLGETPLSGFHSFVKRSMDCLVAGLALIIASPVMLFVSILIKLDSNGPIVFVQERVGNDGRKFNIYKFRSMIDQAEKDTGPKWATANDPRTTRVGRFIRMYNLDELPQFINVLKGDMSLVGPRPERPYFVDKFKEQIPRYMHRHMVKTGITGWAQVNGLRGDTSVVKRTKYDLYYVKNWSLFFDLKILLKTLTSFKNAY